MEQMTVADQLDVEAKLIERALEVIADIAKKSAELPKEALTEAVVDIRQVLSRLPAIGKQAQESPGDFFARTGNEEELLERMKDPK